MHRFYVGSNPTARHSLKGFGIMTDLKIDNEFKELIPPLTDDEKKQLEENILRDGIQDPLKVWQGTLIDGHNRYEIARRHGLTFKTVEMQFPTRDDVKIWIIKNQFGRRNLSAYDRSILALKLKPVIAAKAKENLSTHTVDGYQGLPNSAKAVNTRQEIAKAAGVGHDTIAKVEKIEAQATPEIKAALKAGDLSINQAYEGVKAGATTIAEVKEKKPHVSFNSGNNEWYTPADIIEAARKTMGSIDLDPASSEIANQTVKATTFYTVDDDGLAQDWYGNIWLNPPYASGLIEKFVDKLLSSDFKAAIVLVNNATDTEWFSKLANCANAVVFPKGRVKFLKPDGNTGAPLQGQAILYFGNDVAVFADIFKQYGRCWR